MSQRRAPMGLGGPPPLRLRPISLPRPTRPTRRNERSAQTQTSNSVIDLTAEPDSPVLERRSTSNSHQSSNSRNPRRTNSQRISPPRLARSDSTFFASTTGVIDLTADSPEQSRPSDSTRSRAGDAVLQDPDDELIELEFISSGPRQNIAMPNIAFGLTRRLAGILGAEFIGFPQPQLDISRPAFASRRPSPKPPMEPIPPTREGFTRDTCAEPEDESETIVVCPACNEELAYDPSGPATQTSPTGGKKRKRAPGEHHFWALKKCGHVYCTDCFENRRPTKAKPKGVGFRFSEENGPYSAATDLRCAVDSCETRVAHKGDWVGIFL